VSSALGRRRERHFRERLFDGTLLASFRTATAITAEPPEKPTRTIAEVIEDVWANRDRDYNIRCWPATLARFRGNCIATP
jgi:type I restriction enzyme R subunit